MYECFEKRRSGVKSVIYVVHFTHQSGAFINSRATSPYGKTRKPLVCREMVLNLETFF